MKQIYLKNAVFFDKLFQHFFIFVVGTISGVQTMAHMIHRHQMNFGQDVRLNKGVSLLTLFGIGGDISISFITPTRTHNISGQKSQVMKPTF